MKLKFTEIYKLASMRRVFAFLGAGVLALSSCTTDPNSPGLEYMPDMYRSPSYETYSQKMDYEKLQEEGLTEAELASNKELAELFKYGALRTPAANSVPRGHKPYAYPNTNEGYELAGERLKNPVALNEETLAEGKRLYMIFCDHCHGEKGDGQGAIITNGAFPGGPQDYKSPTMIDLPEGKMFHTIHYGKGLMGSHASQLSQEERWMIIHFIQEMQGKHNEVIEEETVEVTDGK